MFERPRRPEEDTPNLTRKKAKYGKKYSNQTKLHSQDTISKARKIKPQSAVTGNEIWFEHISEMF